VPSMEDERRDRYYIEADALGRKLDECLAGIRSREDSGAITAVESAGERIAAMEAHGAAVRALRKEYPEFHMPGAGGSA
jgi:hypothetical protein